MRFGDILSDISVKEMSRTFLNLCLGACRFIIILYIFTICYGVFWGLVESWNPSGFQLSANTSVNKRVGRSG